MLIQIFTFRQEHRKVSFIECSHMLCLLINTNSLQIDRNDTIFSHLTISFFSRWNVFIFYRHILLCALEIMKSISWMNSSDISSDLNGYFPLRQVNSFESFSWKMDKVSSDTAQYHYVIFHWCHFSFDYNNNNNDEIKRNVFHFHFLNFRDKDQGTDDIR